jgi:hypothetical protein
MSLYTRTYTEIVKRRERLLSGNVNCIPWGLPRFENENPGIEKGKYYLITANQKVGRLIAPIDSNVYSKFRILSYFIYVRLCYILKIIV